ncbi:MAG: hypothetical protein R2712_04015 [Vicinamibacterales bacterium]
MKSVSPRMARPRLLAPQQTLAASLGVWRYNQNSAPVLASTAITSLGRCVRYITPSTTSGFDCQAPNTWFWTTHFSSRPETLAGVMASSVLYRWLM